MIPSREKQLDRLRSEKFDILIIGGGATGSGLALDAATRGYKVALVEAGDFASGTSSRSTKLIHGGVRYLEDAVKHLNRSQFNLVRDSLHERSTLLKIAPHLTRILPIFTPAYSLWEKGYFGMGMKLYDLLSGSGKLKNCRFVSKEESLQLFPNLKQEGLKGGILYYDGQFDDARMNVSLILTAVSYGAVVANYLPVVQVNKTEEKITSVTVKENFLGQEWEIKATLFVNAGGPFADEIRRLDDPQASPILKGSAGTHILLDRKHCPADTGFLIPKTSDGRVLFILPWQGSTLLGTTDIPTKILRDPRPSEEEIQFLVDHYNKYMRKPITKGEIKSSWTGIRPLICEGKEVHTASLSRDFKIDVSPSKLYSIAGGKWTTYRKMAADLLDTAIKNQDLPQKGPCITEKTFLIGANGEIKLDAHDLDKDVIEHLIHSYGDQANEVLKIAQKGYKRRLALGYPYIEAEAIYGIRREYACTEMDILARRTRLYTLDQKAAKAALPRVTQLLRIAASK